MQKTEQDITEDAEQILKDAGVIKDGKAKVESATEIRTYSSGERLRGPISNNIMEAEVVEAFDKGLSVKVTDENYLYRNPGWEMYDEVGVSMIQEEERPPVAVGERVYICYNMIQESSPPTILAEMIFYS